LVRLCFSRGVLSERLPRRRLFLAFDVGLDDRRSEGPMMTPFQPDRNARGQMMRAERQNEKRDASRRKELYVLKQMQNSRPEFFAAYLRNRRRLVTVVRKAEARVFERQIAVAFRDFLNRETRSAFELEPFREEKYERIFTA
jgi:hypothetical protein